MLIYKVTITRKHTNIENPVIETKYVSRIELARPKNCTGDLKKYEYDGKEVYTEFGASDPDALLSEVMNWGHLDITTEIEPIEVEE